MDQVMTMLNQMIAGAPAGSSAERLIQHNMDPGALRPFIGIDGRQYISVMKAGKQLNVPVFNATLTYDEWKEIDRVVMQTYQQRPGAFADVLSAGLTVPLVNAMGKMVFQYEKMSDVNDAQWSMDAVTKGLADRPDFTPESMPLPIASADYYFTARALAASRNYGDPLDMTMVEVKTRKIAEAQEKLLVMGTGGITFGGNTIYGYVNHPSRNQVTLGAHWNDSAASGETILADVLAMKQALINDRCYGPYSIYIPTAYETALDGNYVSDYPETIRQRIMKVEGIKSVKVCDFLTGDNIVMVQMTSDVVRIINGFGVTPVQWDSQGGLQINYKLMALQIPQIRADYDGRCGIAHGSK